MINMILGGKMRVSGKQARILFVTLFVTLLLLGPTVGLMHVHPDGAGHTDCALCQSAHNIARPSVAAHIRPIVFAAIRISLPQRREYREHLFSYSHWNRPPPDQIAVA